MFEKLSDNLNLLMAKARVNASELARRTGLPASSIKKIRNHNNPNPTLSTLIPIAECFSISVSQLIGDIELPVADVAAVKSYQSLKQRIPLLSWQESIPWVLNSPFAPADYLAFPHEYSENTYALTINEPDWNDFKLGSTLIIDPTAIIEHRDFVIVLKEGHDTPTLRQVLLDESDTYLKPVITGYNVSTLTPQHKILGVVMEYRKKLKKHKI